MPWFPPLWGAPEALGAGHACTWPICSGPCCHLRGAQLASPHVMKETWELQATKPPIGGHTQGSGTHESESRLPAVPGPHLLAPSPQAHRISLSKPAKPPRRVDKLLSNKTKKPHAAKCGIAPSEPDPSHHHGSSPPETPFSHPPFEGEHGHCPPRGQSGLWGTWLGGAPSPELPARSARLDPVRLQSSNQVGTRGMAGTLRGARAQP